MQVNGVSSRNYNPNFGVRIVNTPKNLVKCTNRTIRKFPQDFFGELEGNLGYKTEVSCYKAAGEDKHILSVFVKEQERPENCTEAVHIAFKKGADVAKTIQNYLNEFGIILPL